MEEAKNLAQDHLPSVFSLIGILENMEEIKSEEKHEKCDFLVIGGGIAGVSCVEQLNLICPDKKTILITATDLVTIRYCFKY